MKLILKINTHTKLYAANKHLTPCCIKFCKYNANSYYITKKHSKL